MNYTALPYNIKQDHEDRIDRLFLAPEATHLIQCRRQQRLIIADD
jgi:hypothetical protein